MKKPPAESKISSVGLIIVTQGLRRVIIVMVLKADSRCVCRGCCQRDHARQVVPSAQQVELNPRKDGQKGQGVDKSKGSGNSCFH